MTSDGVGPGLDPGLDLMGELLGSSPQRQDTVVAAGRTVSLRPVTDADVESLFRLATAGGNLGRWRLQNRTISPNNFHQFIWGGCDAQFVVEDKEHATPIGHVCSYQTDEFNGTTKVAAMFRPELHGRGWPLEGMFLFLRFLFEAHPLRVVYLEMPGFNVPSLSTFLARHVREEGRLVENLFSRGRYWDLHIFALHRDSWNELCASPVAQRLALV